MITKIAIENFKGIGERVEVDIRPLTLLFGPNSAGKSSILHALHYAREIFERQNINPDRTIAGGEFVDLGGFPAFVHNHDLGREVTISIRLDLRGISLPEYGPPVMSGAFLSFRAVKEITSAEVTVCVAWNHVLEIVYVREYSVNLDGEWMCSVELPAGSHERRLKINTAHRLLTRIGSCRSLVNLLQSASEPEPDDEFDPFSTFSALKNDDSALLGLLALAHDSCLLTVDLHGNVAEVTVPAGNVLPSWNSQSVLLPFDFGRAAPNITWSDGSVENRMGESRVDYLLSFSAPDDHLENDEETPEDGVTAILTTRLDAAISAIVIGPCRRAYEAFQKLRYVGPLRETPSRTYSPPRYPDPSRWACGLGAWDELHTGNRELIPAVSRWLGDRDRLDAGYHLQRKEYKEIDLNDPIVADFLAGKQPDETLLKARLQMTQLPTQAKLIICPNGRKVELSPHDVGVGISQLIPVVVTALAGGEHLLVIEQPELHLHPRLQAKLGDLFIEAATGERKQTVILETHSEHLLLRLLRRIRETSEGTLPGGCRSLKPDQLAVLYVESVDGDVRVTRLHVTDDGDFAASWPGGFFDERAEELF